MSFKIELRDGYGNTDCSLIIQKIISYFNRAINCPPVREYNELIVREAPDGFPMVAIKYLPQYMIHLAGVSNEIPRLAYQFSHELTHVYIDPRKNNWLVESFCEAMSYWTLETLHTETLNRNYSECLQIQINGYKTRLMEQSSAFQGDYSSFDLMSALELLNKSDNREINAVLAYFIFEFSKNHARIIQLIPKLHWTVHCDSESAGSNYVDSIRPDMERFIDALNESDRKLWSEFLSFSSLDPERMNKISSKR